MTKQEIESSIKALIREWAKLEERPAKVRYSGPVFGPEEYESMMDAVFSGWGSGGSYTLKSEKKLAEISRRSHGLLTNSGSSANLVLMSAARDLYFKDGDKIATLACGFPTTVSPIMYNRLVPVFLDIDLDSLNLSPEVFEEACKKQSIKGLFVAHTLGFKSNIDDLLFVARKYGVQVFFDCCDAYGSTYRDLPVQHYGKAASFSFYVAHHITSLEGGGVVTNDPDMNEAMRGYRSWGRYCAADRCCIRAENPNLFCPTGKRTRNSTLPSDYSVNYQYEWLGFNIKPLEIQSAILLKQFDKLDEFNQIRKRNYASLLQFMKKYDEFFMTWEIDDDVSPFAFPFLIKQPAAFLRKHLTDAITQDGIEHRLLFGGNLTRHPAFVNRKEWWETSGSLKSSDYIMNSMVLLGVSQVVTDSDIEKMKACISSFIERHT
jgi:CDP-4-dehydro-6-deoxyglucose reductase, E1